MNDDEPSDSILLAAANAGDDAAFAALVRRYVRRATLLAAQLIGSRQDAEDVAQEAFVVVHKKAKLFDDGRPFAPWFFTIVRKLAANRRTRNLRRARLLRFWGRTPVASSPASRSETALIAQLDAATATRAMASLSPMQRACFELVVLRGLSHEEVAVMHDISESTVRQHVFRARATLRARLAGGARDSGNGDA